MRRACLVAIALAFALPLSVPAQGDKEKKEPELKILNKTIGEWIKILQTSDKENEPGPPCMRWRPAGKRIARGRVRFLMRLKTTKARWSACRRWG